MVAPKPTALVVHAPAAGLASLGPLVEVAAGYAADARAPNTRTAYASDFRAFETWCAARGLEPMPATPATVAVYLADLATRGRKYAGIARALSSIAATHRARNAPWTRGAPAVTEVMHGIARRHGTAPSKKAPVGDVELAALLGTLGVDLRGLRDRALLTVGWFGAFRRSEIVALTVADVLFERDGLRVTMRRSKTDQEGKGYEKGLPFAGAAALCPVRALRAWLDGVNATEGPLFRRIDRHGNVYPAALTDESVALVVKRCALAAGLDPARYAGHSLRSGFATTAARKRKSLDAIMRQTGHKSERVARGYIQHATLFDDNAAAGLV
jgi:site-specific recombinase XerD